MQDVGLTIINNEQHKKLSSAKFIYSIDQSMRELIADFFVECNYCSVIKRSERKNSFFSYKSNPNWSEISRADALLHYVKPSLSIDKTRFTILLESLIEGKITLTANDIHPFQC